MLQILLTSTTRRFTHLDNLLYTRAAVNDKAPVIWLGIRKPVGCLRFTCMDVSRESHETVWSLSI